MSIDPLPPETQEFLARLTPEDIKTLEEGTKLITAMRRVGAFVKWLIIGVLGIFAGIIMFYESLVKMAAWFRG